MMLRVSRRGQAEIIGGLIILTIIFLMAVPLMFSLYERSVRSVEEGTNILTEAGTIANERLTIIPVDPSNEDYVNLGWVPGVFIINRGVVEVQLVKAYLINVQVDRIVYILDLTTLRPEVLGSNPIVEYIALNATPINPNGDPLPPAGEPITLAPGDSLLLVFNLLNPEDYVIAVESARGVLHPVGGGSEGGRLVPQGGGAGGGAQPVSLRPLFAPQGGFRLEGAQDLQAKGALSAWRPAYSVSAVSNFFGEPAISYISSFIYDDPDPEHRGLSLVYIEAYDVGTLYVGPDSCPIEPYSEIYIHGYIGTYYNYEGPFGFNFTYLDGYAVRVEVRYTGGSSCIVEAPVPFVSLDPTTSSSFNVDFDGNNVTEMAVYSLYNAPLQTPNNVDADGDGSQRRDVLVWQYIVARDIGNSDYIRITGKINYYWTAVFFSGCPSSFRPLKTFSVVVYKFDEATGTWDLTHWKDFYFVKDKPRQFHFTVLFPVDRNSIYRVGVLFYDYYQDFLDDCYIDFTYTLEFLNIEFGVVNPLFRETPPIYVVAIPDPNLISGIGEDSYASWAGVTLDEAKLAVQNELLNAIDTALNLAGIGNYTVVDSVSKLCNLLFPDKIAGSTMAPPRDAIIFWLQGDVSLSDVTLTPGSPCFVTEQDLASYIETYGWIFIQATGTPFWGSPTSILPQNTVNLLAGGEASLTPEGEAARVKYSAFAMTDTLQFNTLVEVTDTGSSYLLPQASFYAQPGTSVYGHAAFTLTGTSKGAYIVMHVVPVWGSPGPTPTTVAQLSVYAGLEAYATLK